MTQLQTTLRQLRLSGLLQTLDVRLQEAAAGRLAHGEFLELIFQDELNVRHQRMLARRTKAADFRALKTLEDFDWQFSPTINRKQIFELAAKIGDPLLLTVGRQDCSAVHCYHGDFSVAVEHAHSGDRRRGHIWRDDRSLERGGDEARSERLGQHE